MMMGGMTTQDNQMQERMNEAKAQIAQIEGPQMRALAMKELEQMSGMVGIMGNTSRKMGDTNDLRHLGEGMQQLNELYSILQHTLLQSQQATRQIKLNIEELRKQGNDDYTRIKINESNCLINCNRRKERILEQAIEKENNIKIQHKDDEDKRDEMLGNLYEETLTQMHRLMDCGCSN
ncbi:hypothetical protein ACFOUP_16540 [Belliella kenyensis]|uniref:Uncharacterized protein n=2 Tax=Belliella kenyensis TaxID=1472724 RepID=A0ABV8EPM3_9BACT